MAKVLPDTTTLTMLTQFCSELGYVSWENFAETMNKTTTTKSRAAGRQGA